MGDGSWAFRSERGSLSVSSEIAQARLPIVPVRRDHASQGMYVPADRQTSLAIPVNVSQRRHRERSVVAAHNGGV